MTKDFDNMVQDLVDAGIIKEVEIPDPAQLLKKVAEERQKKQAADAELQALWDEVVKTDAYTAYTAKRDSVQEYGSEVAKAEAEARTAIAAAWTPDKPKKNDGYTIQERTVLTVLDEMKAKQWALLNMPDSVSIKADVAKMAAKLKVDWVSSKTETTAALASDLSSFLK